MAKDNGQTDLELKQKGAVATTQFESFEGTGFEEVTTEDLAIPFIRILPLFSPGFWVRFRREAVKKIHNCKTITKISKFS